MKKKPYDLIFMDVHMPEMDGLEATRKIRQLGKRGEAVRIVALTADAVKGEREVCLGVGMNDYVTKPVKIETLRRIIENKTT
jgi:CheY-like chemotaxis protein